ncbi:rho GTPase-activating protein 31 isoform X2 [Coregonus clupeaformis]|uniref:rho GTPase-activating protein 31 isoform X2 n=1 Tax=Coregonus clupeaformis TaxID=59861 RepID=UPI001BE0A777|nr:rho GTPase-activating protein 31 isoform X2 [Coregonus clupeaformis]
MNPFWEMKNKGAKQRSKKKGSENAFGCDLTEHLQNSGQDVPQVLKTCAEFIEKHGVVDGIYRLSGVTSNIQRLRQEFCAELCPDLTKEMYLQDIHCVGSLCKLYFRELPNPLLTYELYNKFTEAVSVQEDHERLQRIQGVIKELPIPHFRKCVSSLFRTLEYLTKHLSHLATLSPQTNMHTRNLALVWAPNLLRSKDIEVASCNGDMAFLEVRVQQSVVEFILNHTEQIFNHAAAPITPKGPSLMCGEKYATLPISGQGGPMKLMSLEEAQARSLSPNHPARKERQRENSLPDTSTATLYHTVIDISDSKKFSGKSKKWKSIFNLGRSVTDSKGKLSRNGSVFMRTQNITEKAAIRPARSMDSLCSLPTDDDKAGNFNSAGEANGFFAPGIKSRTLGSDSLYDLSEHQRWEFEMKKSSEATGCSSPKMKRRGSPSVSPPQQKALPEQLKVFKGDDLSSCQPTSPKNRRMLYSGSTHSSTSRPSFPGSLFPESSPRHQRKALNISEPFAVSVPLRVSAVISSNSTPCRATGKERPAAAALKPSRETSQSEQSDSSGGSSYREHPLVESRIGSESSIYSNSSSTPLEKEARPVEERSREEAASKRVPEVSGSEGEVKEVQGKVEVSDLRQSSTPNTREEDKEKQQSPGNQLDNQPAPQHEPKELTQLDMGSLPIKEELWCELHLELKITEPELDIMEEEFMPVFCSTKNTREDIKAKRRSSLPTHSLLYKGQPLMPAKPALTDQSASTVAHSAGKNSSDTLFPFDKTFNFMVGTDMKNTPLHAADSTDITENKPHISPKSKLTETDKPISIKPRLVVPHLAEPSLHFTQQSQVIKHLQPGDDITDIGMSVAEKGKEPSWKSKSQDGVKGFSHDDGKNALSVVMGGIERLSICLEERPHTLGLPHQDDEDGCGGHSELEDLEEEPWEEVLSSTKQWVTSPLHSPTFTDLFVKLDVSSSCSVGEGLSSKDLNVPPQSRDDKPTNGSCPVRSIEVFPENSSLACSGKTETKITHLLPLPSKTTLVSDDPMRPHRGNSCTAAQQNTTSSQRFHRQTSYEASYSEKTGQNSFSKHRPYSLNWDLGLRCIRDISNQQNLESAELSSIQRGAVTPSGTKSNGLSKELELFLSDRQAPVRRNSAPVSVSSVRTAFMIKTCQAKAVPVIPPKVQYSHIPHPTHNKGSVAGKEPEKELTKTRGEKLDTLPLLASIRDLKEELENKEPAPKSQIRQAIAEKSTETNKTTPISDPPVLRRKHSSNAEAFADCPRPERSTVLQRPSFRNRQRPQSLILFSPPFPIMDYPPLGDDGKLLLSPIRSPTETSALDVFSKEMADNLRTPEGVTLRNKMTIPKSGQRLETSTSCFYQPQRRSMIFDNRSHRQIE